MSEIERHRTSGRPVARSLKDDEIAFYRAASSKPRTEECHVDC
jgi:hypothetical protein